MVTYSTMCSSKFAGNSTFKSRITEAAIKQNISNVLSRLRGKSHKNMKIFKIAKKDSKVYRWFCHEDCKNSKKLLNRVSESHPKQSVSEPAQKKEEKSTINRMGEIRKVNESLIKTNKDTLLLKIKEVSRQKELVKSVKNVTNVGVLERKNNSKTIPWFHDITKENVNLTQRNISTYDFNHKNTRTKGSLFRLLTLLNNDKIFDTAGNNSKGSISHYNPPERNLTNFLRTSHTGISNSNSSSHVNPPTNDSQVNNTQHYSKAFRTLTVQKNLKNKNIAEVVPTSMRSLNRKINNQPKSESFKTHSLKNIPRHPSGKNRFQNITSNYNGNYNAPLKFRANTDMASYYKSYLKISSYISTMSTMLAVDRQFLNPVRRFFSSEYLPL